MLHLLGNLTSYRLDGVISSESRKGSLSGNSIAIDERCMPPADLLTISLGEKGLKLLVL